MRRSYYLVLILLLIAQTTFGQVYQNMAQPGYKFGRARFDSVLTIPSGITRLRNINGGRDTGQIRYVTTDSSLYVYTGRTWVKVNGSGGGGGSTDTTSLSNRINQKLAIVDTANKWVGNIQVINDSTIRVYEGSSFTDLQILGKANSGGGSGGLDTTKIPLSGTVVGKPITGDLVLDNDGAFRRIKGAIQDSYIEFTDDGVVNINSQSGSNVNIMGVDFAGQNFAGSVGITGIKNYSANYSPLTYIQKVYSDSITNLKLNKSDTATMLSPYSRSAAVTSSLALKLNISDTASMLTPYQRDITLTTFNADGNASFINNVLNIPNYALSIPTLQTVANVGRTVNNGINFRIGTPASIEDGVMVYSSGEGKLNLLSLNADDVTLDMTDMGSASVNLKFPTISGTFALLSDTATLSDRIDLKQNLVTLTTTGSSGAATFNQSTGELNIPNYAGGGGSTDTTSLSNRINLKLNISDTATMLTPYELKNKNWGLLGNAGTNALTNFIGTTDNVDFEIRRNNITALKLYSSNVRMAANDFPNLTTGTRNLFLGSSNRNTILDNRVTSGVRNISVISGGYTNTIGNDNISIGANSNINNSLTNTTGNNNIAIGASAGTSGITSGNDNISVGRSANDNLYLGGSRNIAIGVYSNKQWAGGYAANGTQGSRNIIIGDSINLPVGNSSNQLNIGNMIYGNGLNGYEETVSTGNIGIGVKIPAQKLEVAGNIKLTGLAFENTDTLATKAYARSVGGGGGSTDTTSLSNRINLKQNLVTLTTTGASGAATFNQSTGALNIPNYAGATLNIEQVLTNGNDAAQIQIKNVAAGTDPEDAVVLIQVSDSLNTKLYLSDTSAMLTPYARTAALTIPTLTQVLESAAGANEAGANQIKDLSAGTGTNDAATVGQLTDTANLRLRISDTAAMLTPYARKASPTFTGTVTLPAGQVVNGVTLTTGGATTNFLNADGTYSAPNGTGGLIGVRFLTTGTTYTPTAGTTRAVIHMIGGGGGGGGTAGINSGSGAGAGGGAGGYVVDNLTGITGTYAYTIGVGGTAGAATSGTGGTGGNTTFTAGTTFTASGGVGGIGAAAVTTATATVPVQGGLGGAAANGDLNASGEGGGIGMHFTAATSVSGKGGTSEFGAGGRQLISTATTAGVAGAGFGAGGGGGVSSGNTNAAGGAGSQGIIIIYEYR